MCIGAKETSPNNVQSITFTDGSAPDYSPPDSSLNDGADCIRFKNGFLGDTWCSTKFHFMCMSDRLMSQGKWLTQFRFSFRVRILDREASIPKMGAQTC